VWNRSNTKSIPFISVARQRGNQLVYGVIILLFGPPGCGKGTQAAFLVERLQIPSISTGEMFRAECKSGSRLGRRVRAILARGGLIGDEIVNAMVAGRIAQDDCSEGFLLDGFPRTVAQAQFFTRLLEQRALPEPLVIHLDVADELLVTRLCARRQCPQCLRIYNLLSHPPAAQGVCDCDGATLLVRDDDCQVSIRQRLSAYQAQTGPVLQWFGDSLVRRVDGSRSAQEVAADVERVVSQPMATTPCMR
jgi:adenylate kinase